MSRDDRWFLFGLVLVLAAPPSATDIGKLLGSLGGVCGIWIVLSQLWRKV